LDGLCSSIQDDVKQWKTMKAKFDKERSVLISIREQLRNLLNKKKLRLDAVTNTAKALYQRLGKEATAEKKVPVAQQAEAGVAKHAALIGQTCSALRDDAEVGGMTGGAAPDFPKFGGAATGSAEPESAEPEHITMGVNAEDDFAESNAALEAAAEAIARADAVLPTGPGAQEQDTIDKIVSDAEDTIEDAQDVLRNVEGGSTGPQQDEDEEEEQDNVEGIISDANVAVKVAQDVLQDAEDALKSDNYGSEYGSDYGSEGTDASKDADDAANEAQDALAEALEAAEGKMSDAQEDAEDTDSTGPATGPAQEDDAEDALAVAANALAAAQSVLDEAKDLAAEQSEEKAESAEALEDLQAEADAAEPTGPSEDDARALAEKALLAASSATGGPQAELDQEKDELKNQMDELNDKLESLEGDMDDASVATAAAGGDDADAALEAAAADLKDSVEDEIDQDELEESMTGPMADIVEDLQGDEALLPGCDANPPVPANGCDGCKYAYLPVAIDGQADSSFSGICTACSLVDSTEKINDENLKFLGDGAVWCPSWNDEKSATEFLELTRHKESSSLRGHRLQLP